MPAVKGVITVRGNQQLARDIERGIAPGQRNIHVLEADNKHPLFKEPKRDKKKQNFQETETKRVPLDKYLPDKEVPLVQPLLQKKNKVCWNFLTKIKTCSLGLQVTFAA